MDGGDQYFKKIKTQFFSKCHVSNFDELVKNDDNVTLP
jgi:hypothetical protein